MKKHIAFLLAAVMLILAACQPSKHGQQGQPETQPATTAPVETTVPPTTVPPTTVAPMDDPTETTLGKDLSQAVLSNDYENEDWEPIVYRKAYESLYMEKGYQTGECVEHYLYSFHKMTGEAVLICDEVLNDVCTAFTAEFIFFVKESNKTEVICSTYDGAIQFVCYNAKYGDIAEITASAPVGLIGILEDHEYLVQYDFENDVHELLLKYKYIDSFYLGFLKIARMVEFTDMNGTTWNYYCDTAEMEEVQYL